MKNTTNLNQSAPRITAASALRLATQLKFAVCALLAMAGMATGATIVTNYTAPGTYDWVVPAGVTSVTVECRGAGGAGGTATRTATSGNALSGGGAGGSYAKTNLTVVSGTTYKVIVGAGGVSLTTVTVNATVDPGQKGGASMFTSFDFTTTNCLAVGGAGGTNALKSGATDSIQGGGPGSSVGCIGDVIFRGGSGGNAVTSGGGGAGGAGDQANAADVGNTNAKGLGGFAGGGDGSDGRGNGAANNSAGTASAPGGGGGGAKSSATGVSNRGGTGGAGGVKLTYEVITAIDHFEVAASSPQTAGVAFNVTVTAHDVAHAVVDDSVTVVTMTSPGGSLMEFDWNGDGTYGDNSGTLTNGVYVIKARNKKAETKTIVASSLAATTTTPPSVTTVANAFTKLQILAPGETATPGTAPGKTGTPNNQTLGVAFNVTVNAVDDYWNLASTNDTVGITSSEVNATLPAAAALASGTGSFAVTLNSNGVFTVTASDQTPGNGTQTPDSVSIPVLLPYLIWDSGNTANGAIVDPANGTWNTTAGNIVWNNGVTNVVWSPTKDAVFGGADGTYAVTVGGSFDAQKILFTNSGYTLSAASAQTITITVPNSGLTVASGKTATIGANVSVLGNTTYYIGTPNASVAGGTLNIEGAGAIVRPVSPANSLLIQGVGTIINVKTGGFLGLASGNASSSLTVGNGVSSDVTLNVDGGTVNLQSHTQTGGSLNVGGDGKATVTLTNSGSIIVNPAKTAGVTFGSGAANVSINTFNLDGGTLTTRTVKKGTATSTAIFNFNGGTLAANSSASGATFMTGLDAANVKDGGARIDTAGFDITIAQNLLNAGAGGLTKVGAGTLTLSGTNTYIGNTTNNAGRLQGVVGGSAANSTNILNSASATNSVSVTANTKGWTNAGFTAAAAGVLEFSFGAVTPSTTISPLQITGLADFVATPTVSVLSSSALGQGTYPLMTWGSVSGTIPTTTELTVSPTPLGTPSLVNDGNTLSLVIAGANIVKTNNQDNLNLASSWVGGAVPGPLEVAKWDNTVTGDNTTLLGADTTWGGITISNPAGAVTISAGNTLTLGAAAKDIDMSTATTNLTLNCDVALGAGNVWDVTNSRTLTVGGAVSGSGTLTKSGAGTAILANSGNTYTNATIISAGTLILSGSVSNTPITISGSGVLNQSAAGAIRGLASVVHNSSGTSILSGVNDYTNATTISAGTLQLGASEVIPHGTGRGNVTVTGTLDLNAFSETVNGLSGAGVVDTIAGSAPTLTVGGNNATSTFRGIIRNTAGTLSLVKVGNGVLTLSGTNTYSGNTIISGTDGVIAVTNTTAPLGTGTFVFNGGRRLRFDSTMTFTNPIIVGPNSGEAQRGLLEVNNALSGVVATLSGPITITNGPLAGGHFYASNNTMIVSGPITATVPVNSRNGTVIFSGGGTGYTSLVNGQGITKVGAPNGIATSATVTVGLSQVGTFDLNGYDQSLVNIIGSGAFSQTITNSSTTTPVTLTLTGGTNTFAGRISDDGGVAKLNLTLNGAKLTLSGSNTYSGATVVSNGTLLVNGSLAAASPVTSYATLGGNGTVNGPVTIAAGGTLAPGTSVGKLTIANNLVLNAASTSLFEFDVAGSTNDLVVCANLTPGGSVIAVSVANGALTRSTPYRLIDYTGAKTGSFGTPVVASGLPAGSLISIDETTTNQINLVLLNSVPVATNVIYSRTSGLTLIIPITNLLSHVSDVDGDTITLVGVSTNASGSTNLVNATNIYVPANTVTDSFTYTVTDGFGGTNTATVTINITGGVFGQGSPSITTTNGNPVLGFAGIPGYSYTVERGTNVNFTGTVISILTTNAPAGGLFQYTDENHGPLPTPEAYYRLKYNP